MTGQQIRKDSLDKILEVGVRSENDVQAHFVCVPIFVPERSNLGQHITISPAMGFWCFLVLLGTNADPVMLPTGCCFWYGSRRLSGKSKSLKSSRQPHAEFYVPDLGYTGLNINDHKAVKFGIYLATQKLICLQQNRMVASSGQIHGC